MEDSVPINVKITPLATTPTPSVDPSATPSATASPSATSTPTSSPTADPSAAPTGEPTATATPQPTTTATAIVPGEKPGAGLPGSGAFGEAAPFLGGIALLAVLVGVTMWFRKSRTA